MSTTAIRIDTDAPPRATDAPERTTDAPELTAREPVAPEPVAPEPGGHESAAAATPPHHRVLSALRTALSAIAELDPDALDTRTPAGRAAVPLAGTARSAVAALGGDPGSALTHAPGIVVGRDLAMATSLLDATARRGGPPTAAAARIAELAAEAERRLADLLRAVTPPG